MENILNERKHRMNFGNKEWNESYGMNVWNELMHRINYGNYGMRQ